MSGSASFASILRSLWTNTIGTSSSPNKPFPDKHFYMIWWRYSYEIATVITLYTNIKEHRRLEVREARFYRKSGPVAHDFFVFGIHDLEANDPSKPLTYIRVDCFGKDSASNSNTSTTGNLNQANSTEGCGLDPWQRFTGSFSSSAPPSDESIYPSAVMAYMRGSQSSVFYRKKADIEEYEFAVQFGQHTDPAALLMLASSIKDVAPEYTVADDDCFYFSKIVTELAVEVLGAEMVSVPSKKKNGGKPTLSTAKLLSEEEFKKLYEGARLRYGEKWGNFEERVSLSYPLIGDDEAYLVCFLKRMVRPSLDARKILVLIYTQTSK